MSDDGVVRVEAIEPGDAWDRTLQRLADPGVSTGYLLDVASFVLAGEMARALPLDLPTATAAAGALRGGWVADSLDTVRVRYVRRAQRRAVTAAGAPVAWDAEDRPWSAPLAVYAALRRAADALPRAVVVADVVVPLLERVIPPVGGFTIYGAVLSARWLGLTLTANGDEPAARAQVVEEYAAEWAADWIAPPLAPGMTPPAWPTGEGA